MKLLLDESIPRQLRAHFPAGFNVRTVQQMGWAGSDNGRLLRLAARSEFDALITADQGIGHQHNPDELPIAVVVMIAHRTRLQELRSLVPQVVQLLSGSRRKKIYRVRDRAGSGSST